MRQRHIALALASAMLAVVTGCGGGGATVPQPTITSVSTSCSPSPILTTQTSTCTSTVSGTGSFSTAVSWSVSPSNLGSISSAGVFNPASAGTATITATSTQDLTKSGSASVVTQIPPPSNLVYPATTITTVVGQAIAQDTPTVTGTVTSYSVSPSLPTGLSLNTTTGAISGTPSVVAAQANYSVTASNSTGSTSATLQITVNPQAPTGLVYPQTAITANVGRPITPDTPSVTGTVSSYSVSPALPTGLSLNASTGTISGTPTAAGAQVTYTVTATNAGGSITATVTIVVLHAQSAFLELGHAAIIQQIQFEGGNLLSVDNSGHWALWNYATDTELANGDGAISDQSGLDIAIGSIAMAGPTFVVETSAALQVRAQSNGQLLSMISPSGLEGAVTPVPWWQLASDGSYIVVGANSGLFVYSTTGQMLASKSGDYDSAKTYAAPGQILIARGAAGQNVIESFSIATGTSTVSSAFSGTFNSWFLDGSRFLTNESTTVRVYSNTGVQQAIVSLPTVQQLTGQGNWIWTYGFVSNGNELEVYPIGSETSAFSYNGVGVTAAAGSGTTIGIMPYASPAISVIDLSGAVPTESDYSLPIAALNAYASSSASKWVVGNQYGALLDGASLSSTPRYFGYGAPTSIAGSSTAVAIATATEKDLVLDASLSTLQETLDYPSAKLALSSDASVLGALANSYDALNFYSLPSENLISSYPSSTGLTDFTLSASGTTIAQVGVAQIAAQQFTRSVSAITGGTSIWWDTGSSGPIFLSPDGTLIAEYSGSNPVTAATNILKNGTLINAVPGVAVGWIDNDRLLVDTYVQVPLKTSPQYSGSTIYSAAGVALSTPPLPALTSIQTVTSDTVYDPVSNSIYSLTTGQPVWTGSLPTSRVGAVAGPNIVYESGHFVVAESY